MCPAFEAAESGPPGCSWRTYRRFSAARGIFPPICHFPFPRKVSGSHTHLRGKCLLLFAGRLIRRAVANGHRIDHFWVHSGSGEPGITPSRRVLAENGLVLDRDVAHATRALLRVKLLSHRMPFLSLWHAKIVAWSTKSTLF